jgi:hypothetical protein
MVVAVASKPGLSTESVKLSHLALGHWKALVAPSGPPGDDSDNIRVRYVDMDKSISIKGMGRGSKEIESALLPSSAPIKSPPVRMAAFPKTYPRMRLIPEQEHEWVLETTRGYQTPNRRARGYGDDSGYDLAWFRRGRT